MLDLSVPAIGVLRYRLLIILQTITGDQPATTPTMQLKVCYVQESGVRSHQQWQQCDGRCQSGLRKTGSEWSFALAAPTSAPTPVLAKAEKFSLSAEDATWIFAAEESSTRRRLQDRRAHVQKNLVGGNRSPLRRRRR